jgi:hypothetical protein
LPHSQQGLESGEQSQIQGVLAKGKSVNHTLQIFLSVITFGFWLFVYIPMAIVNRRQTKIIRIDDFGNTLFGAGVLVLEFGHNLVIEGKNSETFTETE